MQCMIFMLITLFVTIVSYRVGWVGYESHLWSCGGRGGAVVEVQWEGKWYGMIQLNKAQMDGLQEEVS